jgi:hypothetical protein
VSLSPDTWVLVVEELMLYLMILGRWFLPRGDVGREQLTQLLFALIAIASDTMVRAQESKSKSKLKSILFALKHVHT